MVTTAVTAAASNKGIGHDNRRGYSYVKEGIFGHGGHCGNGVIGRSGRLRWTATRWTMTNDDGHLTVDGKGVGRDDCHGHS